MLIVTYKPLMLIVIMLNIVKLSVVALALFLLDNILSE
jgi:hypothetical protein